MLKVCADFWRAIRFYVDSGEDIEPNENYDKMILKRFLGKIKTAARIWLAISMVGFEMGFLMLYFKNYPGAFLRIAAAVLCAAISAFYYRYEKSAARTPVGIVKKFKTLKFAALYIILSLVYGVGFLGFIYELVLWNFVRENAASFNALEKDFKSEKYTISSRE